SDSAFSRYYTRS
nr:Chain B, co-regulator peptide [synthetic construct]4OJ9_B Chain B, co-regulator peptide [synthetic construct]4OLM_B Chain B, co-regulator peptide [synthetic construct]